MDTRGKPIDTTSNENLKRLYNLASDDDDDEDESKCIDNDQVAQEKIKFKPNGSDEPAGKSSESEDDSENDAEKPDVSNEAKATLTEAEKKKLHSVEIDYTRGEGNFFSEESSSDSSDTEREEEDEDSMHEWGEMDKDAERTEESTTRLALCNMDWDRLNAADLMVLFHSFVPPGGVLKSISIYPSEFGKQRLAEEELHGPRELVEDKLDSDDEKVVDGDEDEEGSGYNMEKLRKYQLNRLKYYYAVLEFDSKDSADKVYTECDGMEYESSATRIDLRFIPEEMTFDEPKDRCEALPDAQKYRPRFFTTTALQQMKVDLTWDETDPRRRELTQRIFNSKDNVDDEDIRAYLASSSESENEEGIGESADLSDDDKKDPVLKYKALLQSIEDSEKQKKDKGVEMEITWGVGLKQKSEALVKKKLEEDSKSKMTPWEEMLAKRREKRQARKAERKEENKAGESNESAGSDNENEDDSSEDDDKDKPFSDDDVDIDINDPFFKEEMNSNEVFKASKTKSKKNVSRKNKTEEKSEEQMKKDAELELLLMDGEDNKRHFSLKKILETETNSSSKKKKNKKWKKVKPVPVADDFEVNLQDNRFSALFSSHHYNVDPSDSNYKKTKGMEALVTEKQKRRLQGEQQKHPQVNIEIAITSKETEDQKSAKRSKSDLAYLVKSIQGKTESLQKEKNRFSHLKKK